MKILNYVIAGTLLFSMPAFAKTYQINTEKSKVVWTGKKVTGKHQGTINIKSGNLKYDGSSLTGGEFVIDMTTVDTTDLSGEYKQKLDSHLKSADFFGTEKHKTAKLVIKSAMFGKGGHWDVVGDLTIKGITKPVMFKTNITKKGKLLVADAKIKFNRIPYGIKYKSGKFFKNLGDKMIYDDVELNIKLTTK